MCYNVFLNGSNVPNSDCNIHYLDRSFPSHKMFIEGTSEGKEGRATLFRVLAVYAMYNPQVSYCQGKPQPVVHFWANAIYYWYLSYCQGKLRPIFPFGQMPLANWSNSHFKDYNYIKNLEIESSLHRLPN